MCRWQMTPKHAYTFDATKRAHTLLPQLSQVAEPLWTDPGLKAELVRELISTQKKKKKRNKEKN